MTVSKLWYDIIRDGRLWKKKYFEYWPLSGKIEEKIDAKGVHSNSVTKDWFTCFWQKMNSKVDTSAIVIDLGSNTVKASYFRNGITNFVSMKSIVAQVPGLYDLHIRRGRFERFYVGEDAEFLWDKKYLVRPIVQGHLTALPLVVELIANVYGRFATPPQKNALIIAEPPFGFEDKAKLYLMKILFNCFQIPRLAFVNSALLSLYNSKATTGIVIISGASYTTVTSIFEGITYHNVVCSSSISEAVLAALTDIPDDQAAVMRNHVFLTGGNALSTSYVEQVKEELKKAGAFKLIVSENAMLDVVEGGAAFSQLSNFNPNLPMKEPNDDEATFKNSIGSEGRFFAWVMRAEYWLRDFYPRVERRKYY